MAIGQGVFRSGASVALNGMTGGNLAMSGKATEPGILRGGSGTVSMLASKALTGAECANRIKSTANAASLAPMTAGTFAVRVNQVPPIDSVP